MSPDRSAIADPHAQRRTTHFATLLSWWTVAGRNPMLPRIWIPASKFVEAVEIGDTIAVTREDDPYFGLVVGDTYLWDERWPAASLSRSIPKEHTAHLTLVGQWDAYGTRTANLGERYVLLDDEARIEDFLREHAPDAAVHPGDPEVLAWVGIVDGDSLQALGALCRWESGGSVLSSITVRTDLRGRGLGRAITRALITHAHALGIDEVALGVWARNDAAKAVYERVGFSLLGEFNTFRA